VIGEPGRDGGAWDLESHVAARTVVGRCPAPLNPVEVAVVLETCGYTTTRARALGASGLPELAQRVFELVPLYGVPLERQARAPVPVAARPPGIVDLVRGLAYSSPWLVSLATLLVSGVSFWASDVALPSIADAVTLATAAALFLTAPFIQAFGRRASFYIGLGDQGSVVRITRLTLELGMVVCAAACGALFLVRGAVLGTGTPATVRLGFAAGIAVASLQLGLASFYVRRAFLAMGAVVAASGGVLLWIASHRDGYLDPTHLIVGQIRLVAATSAVCWFLSAWWLLRVRGSAPAPLWRPSGPALFRAVAPYALYGVGFFMVVVLPMLVSTGLFQGRVRFNAPFAMASGAALVVLIPVLAQTVAASEHLITDQLPAWLSRFTVSQVVGFRQKFQKYWRGQLRVLCGLELVTGVAAVVWLPRLGGAVHVLSELANHQGLLLLCTVGYLFLGAGMFCCQMMFSLSDAVPPVVASLAGAAGSVVGSIAAVGTGPAPSAAIGLIVGAGVFAVVALVSAHRAFARVDFTYYRAL
jgi:hypothetical protein